MIVIFSIESCGNKTKQNIDTKEKISFQEISQQGIRNIGPTIAVMAAAEQLEGHKNAVSIRLNKLKR